MPTYQPTKPQDTDFLARSAGDIRDNFTQANVVYGTDHYAFNNVSPSLGFHNTVTTPIVTGSAHPATAVGIPKMYAMQDLAAIGVLQYSRGGNNAIPTPLTNISSGTVPITLTDTGGGSNFTNILDCTGLATAYMMVWAHGQDNLTNTNPYARLAAYVVFVGNSISISSAFNRQQPGDSTLSFTNNGAILRLTNSSNAKSYGNVFWTLEFIRITV